MIEVHYTTGQLAKLLDKEGTQAGGVPGQGHNQADYEDGRYWARTSDPQLVDRARAIAIHRRK